MSTEPTSAGTPAVPSPGVPGWLREPLLHFLVLGALLFAADRLVNGNPDSARTIVVGPEATAQAVSTFRNLRGRDPDEAELKALLRTWLDNELLYRYGMQMQVDKGDPMIRDRVIFKALSVIDGSLAKVQIDEPGLRAWFEKNRARYDEPQRFDFHEAVLAGERTQAASEALAQRLNSEPGGEIEAGLRVFEKRPRESMVQTYGQDLTDALVAAPVGKWVALQHGRDWRVMRLDAVIAPKPADFEVLSGVALQDWRDEAASQRRTEAVRALEKQFVVRWETDDAR